MKLRSGPVVAFLVVLFGIATSNVAIVRAQGVTGAALRGTITTEDGESADGAFLTLRNTATGVEFTAIAENGGYFFDNVPPGGPYTLTVESTGYRPLTRDAIELRLGQRVTIDLTLRLDGEVIVIEVDASNALADRGRTGAVSRVTRERIAGLPLQGRNFADLASTTPQVNRDSIGGQNNRYNNIQIDGGANNDLFGLAASGTPGGQSGAKPLSVEAIDQFVVQVAPFDVRQSNFAGGQINAITKSGTNDFHGSLFAYRQDKKFLGVPLAGFRDDPTFNSFDTTQVGGTIGGPILRDKAHFFVSADVQRSESAFGNAFQISGADPVLDPEGAAADRERAGFDVTQVNDFRRILATYGIDNAGDASPPELENPDLNLFAKVSTSVIPNSYLDVSYNLVDAGQDILTRSPTAPSIPARLRDGYQLSNSGYAIANTTNTVRAKLITNWDGGRIANEALAGYSRVRDNREIDERTPLILVKVGQLGTNDSWLAAGAERFSQSNRLDQDVYQLQDNFTYALGDHRITAGVSGEYLDIRNVFLQAATGVWAFNSLADFEAGNAAAFERRFGISDDQEPGTAEFNVFQIGTYLQDEWTVAKNVTVMPGLRVDIPYLSDANRNPALLTTALPIDTSEVPSGNPLWSPRLGVNWDVSGDTTSILRGGVGIFTGRPPYVWVANAYGNNGLSQRQITCTAANGVPVFTADPDAQPTACGMDAPMGGATAIDYFDPDTRYPQNLRVSVGGDRRITEGLTATVDFLYTRDVNAFYINDENLVAQGVNGEGREVYGTFAGGMNLGARPTRVDTTAVSNAMKVFNKEGGRVYNVTLQLQQRLGDYADISAGYTYSQARDRISLTSSQAFSNFQFAPVDGPLDDRNVRPSAFDRPHKLTLSGIAKLPLGFGVGLSYIGTSGAPYTWITNGDVNADGVSGNDPAFIPADPSQISLQDPGQYEALDAFVNSQPCLRAARGGVIGRGACRNPWFNLLNLRLSWASPKIVTGKQEHRFEVQFDIFNVLNLLNDDWGLLDQAAQFETHGSAFLRAVNYDAANQRPIYTFTAPAAIEQTIYTPTQSRWRMQLGARYTF